MENIRNIKSIKDLDGIFDWSRNPKNLPDFKEKNFIYGPNASGKTTLSRFFAMLQDGSSQASGTLRYSLCSNKNNQYTERDAFPTKIKVFNKDYVNSHIDFDSSSTRDIRYSATVSAEISRRIRNNRESLKELEKQKDEAEKALTRTKQQENEAFTNIAKTISAANENAIVRNYNRNNAKNDYEGMGGEGLLDEDELSRTINIVRQNNLNDVGPIDDVFSVKFRECIAKGIELLSRKISTNVINRLQDNPDLAGWVQAGIKLHKDHNSHECEFCGALLNNERLMELARFFNAENEKLQDEIEEVIQDLRGVYLAVEKTSVPDELHLYSQFRPHYRVSILRFNQEKEKLLSGIKDLGEKLQEKKSRPTVDISGTIKEELTPDALLGEIQSINGLFSQHNQFTRNLDKAQRAASRKVIGHYLSSIHSEVEDSRQRQERYKEQIAQLSKNISKKKEEIQRDEQEISSTKAACVQLNKNLHSFLGRDEVAFIENQDGTGYLIQRHGVPAVQLSDGERTAIAFTFFITELSEESFDLQSSIIVIDDPVSSLDSSSLYQAFAFIKECTKNAGQLFILTHNFQFLRLLLDWQKRDRKHKQHSCFMIRNYYTENNTANRFACLDKLDPTLEYFDTEYQYLYKQIYSYSNEKGLIEVAYPLPNLVRKFLETCLANNIPNSDSLYDKLTKVDFNEKKKFAIYKMINDNSHKTGEDFNPALVPETEKAIQYLLEMVESAFPLHAAYLKEAIDTTSNSDT